MPWEETENYIRSGHRESGETCHTIEISAKDGINAVYCKYADGWAIQSYLFAKDEGWTMSKAKAWFGSHKESMHLDFITILKNFVRHYGDALGNEKFGEWAKNYKLNIFKPYIPQAQLMRECVGCLCESFRWSEPLIQYLKQDKEARYYKVKALTANISMNKNDYTDTVELARSAPTLTGVRLNINHDHSRWLPHPENRVEWAAYEDNAVEAIIRIHNSQKEIQRKLDNGDILNPSIEGDPRGGIRGGDGGFVPKWYELTALALLEKDYTLPGDPTTYGFEPVVLTESLGRSLVESLSRKDVNEMDKPELGEAVWNPTADWPDSSYMHVPDSAKGADGNKSDRKLPYKWPDGKVDCPHVLAIITTMQGARGGADIPANLKTKYLTQSQGIYKTACNPDYKPGETISPIAEMMTADEIKAKILSLEKDYDTMRPKPEISKSQASEDNWRERELLRLEIDAWKDVYKSRVTTPAYAMEGVREAYIIDSCSQCASFLENVPRVETVKRLTGVTDDTEVVRITNALASAGFCSIAKQLVRKADAACSDGRPRDTPTGLSRTVESVGELMLKSENADLKDQIISGAQKVSAEISAHVETKKQLVEATDRNARKEKDLAVHAQKILRKEEEIARLGVELSGLREQLDGSKNERDRDEIRIGGLEKDVDLYKGESNRLESALGKTKKELTEKADEFQRGLVKLNDESTKRAESQQRALNAENDKARAIRETAELTEQLSARTREVSDVTQVRAEQAKQMLKLQQETNALRERNRVLEEQLTSAARLAKQLPKRLRIKI